MQLGVVSVCTNRFLPHATHDLHVTSLGSSAHRSTPYGRYTAVDDLQGRVEERRHQVSVSPSVSLWVTWCSVVPASVKASRYKPFQRIRPRRREMHGVASVTCQNTRFPWTRQSRCGTSSVQLPASRKTPENRVFPSRLQSLQRRACCEHWSIPHRDAAARPCRARFSHPLSDARDAQWTRLCPAAQGPYGDETRLLGVEVVATLCELVLFKKTPHSGGSRLACCQTSNARRALSTSAASHRWLRSNVFQLVSKIRNSLLNNCTT